MTENFASNLINDGELIRKFAIVYNKPIDKVEDIIKRLPKLYGTKTDEAMQKILDEVLQRAESGQTSMSIMCDIFEVSKL